MNRVVEKMAGETRGASNESTSNTVDDKASTSTGSGAIAEKKDGKAAGGKIADLSAPGSVVENWNSKLAPFCTQLWLYEVCTSPLFLKKVTTHKKNQVKKR